MQKNVFRQLLRRPGDSYKYNFGHVLIIGGSSGMVGAPFLAGLAALRVGAGLVTIASVKDVIDKLEKRVAEIMTLRLASEAAESLSIIKEYIDSRKVSVIVLGPGMSPTAAPLVKSLLKDLSLPMIIDGSALGIIAKPSSVLKLRAAKDLVLTPHMGELQHFFKEPLPKDQVSMLKIAKTLATEQQLTLVVKGHPTHTITADGKVYPNSSGGPALATAGTGDVLSGMIGGIISQAISPEEATIAAVYLHGKAGDIAADIKTDPGVIATDVIDCIPKALKIIESSLD